MPLILELHTAKHCLVCCYDKNITHTYVEKVVPFRKMLISENRMLRSAIITQFLKIVPGVFWLYSFLESYIYAESCYPVE